MAKKAGSKKKTPIMSGSTTKTKILETVQSRSVEKQNYTIRINKVIGEKFREFCENNEVSMSDMVEEFFRRELSTR